MDAFIIQPEKIVSWTQIHDIDTLIQFYINCYNYLPEFFIGAGVFAAVVGLYVAFNLEKVKMYIRVLIMAGKTYLYNRKNL